MVTGVTECHDMVRAVQKESLWDYDNFQAVNFVQIFRGNSFHFDLKSKLQWNELPGKKQPFAKFRWYSIEEDPFAIKFLRFRFGHQKHSLYAINLTKIIRRVEQLECQAFRQWGAKEDRTNKRSILKKNPITTEKTTRWRWHCRKNPSLLLHRYMSSKINRRRLLIRNFRIFSLSTLQSKGHS